MAFTRHGHQIPGTTANVMYAPTIARCGGIQICKSCQEDASELAGAGTQMAPQNLQEKAKKILVNYVDSHYSNQFDLPEFEVYIVWFAKALQNWKALLSTDMPDGKYYELTHDGDKGVTYVDEYVKVKNTTVFDKKEDNS